MLTPLIPSWACYAAAAVLVAALLLGVFLNWYDE